MRTTLLCMHFLIIKISTREITKLSTLKSFLLFLICWCRRKKPTFRKLIFKILLLVLKLFIHSRCSPLFKATYGHKHCVKSVRIRSFSAPYFSAFRLDMDQKNYEKGHFLRSERVARTVSLPCILPGNEFYWFDLMQRSIQNSVRLPVSWNFFAKILTDFNR